MGEIASRRGLGERRSSTVGLITPGSLDRRVAGITEDEGLVFFAALDLRQRLQPWLGCVAVSVLALKLIYVQSECVRRLSLWSRSAGASDAVAAPCVRAHHLPDAVECAVEGESEPFCCQSPQGP